MGFPLSIDLFLGEKACGPKKKLKELFFLHTILEFLCLVQLRFLDLDCCNPPQYFCQNEDMRGGERLGW